MIITNRNITDQQDIQAAKADPAAQEDQADPADLEDQAAEVSMCSQPTEFNTIIFRCSWLRECANKPTAIRCTRRPRRTRRTRRTR